MRLRTNSGRSGWKIEASVGPKSSCVGLTRSGRPERVSHAQQADRAKNVLKRGMGGGARRVDRA